MSRRLQLHSRHHCQASRGKQEPEPEPLEPGRTGNRLATTIKRKQAQLQATLKEMGEEALEEQLQAAGEFPVTPAHRFATLIECTIPTGRPVLVFELSRPSPSTTSSQLAEMAQRWVSWGADALVVPTDAEVTSTGSADLLAVCRAVSVPVLQRDWILHPLQITDCKAAGAAGLLGIITQVSGRGTAVMSSYAAALGLDAPVEVCNRTDVQAMSQAGVGLFGVNLAVGLSLALPNFATDMAKGLLADLPFGAASLVGIRSFDEALKARLAGADAIFVKNELINPVLAERKPANPYQKYGMEGLIERLKDVTCGDD
ncbi:hypothetical protein WJX74_008352 [Apatococcus lobatus]|uniref:indole-3-glycerol-phosphate synthase n=1 Tax=Apatococcus lobatus TaxID=904363 RepID=A0AAW1RJK3_9CHLO